MLTRPFDVVVVGGSVGGCTAATLFARRGLSVALLEKADDLAHYKKVCTHYLQPVAMDVLRDLGLAERIEVAGGRRNEIEVWTEWGWIRGDDPAAVGHGYNIRRETLDPILRRLAIEALGVEFFPGTSVDGLEYDADGRVCGVTAEGETGRERFVAPLVVAADGRNSRLAELAGIETHTAANDRFTYYTYYRGVPFRSAANSLYWHLDPNLAYAFQNDGDTLLAGIFLPKTELRRFKADPMGEFRRFWDGVPDAPIFGDARPITEIRGMTEMPNLRRRASVPGLALVGDSALALDPIWGTGCSFAFVGANWLVERTAPAFLAPGRLRPAIDRGLASYRRVLRARMFWHDAHISHFSRLGPRPAIERWVFAAAARDPVIATRVLSYFGRTTTPLSLFTPSNLTRATMVNLRHALAPPPAPNVPIRLGHGTGVG